MAPQKIFVPNDPANGAPPQLEPLRAFINSVDLEAVRSGDASDRLQEWYASFTGEGRLDEPQELAAFREALREALASHDEGRDDGWPQLEPFAQKCRYKMKVDAERPRLVPQSTGALGAIEALFAIAYDALADGTWQRLKVCRKSSCRWAFYDRSKNASGAWCNMAICGNRVKAQRRRAREKTPKTSA